MDRQELVQVIIEWDANAVSTRENTDRPAVQVLSARLPDLMRYARSNSALAFDVLLDHTAIDWPDQGRFELVYQLYSTVHGHYLMVSTLVNRDNPIVATVSDIWPVAHWQEREVFDMFGILYDNHPDLRRVFLDDEWKGFPLRKDYQDPDMLELPK